MFRLDLLTDSLLLVARFSAAFPPFLTLSLQLDHSYIPQEPHLFPVLSSLFVDFILLSLIYRPFHSFAVLRPEYYHCGSPSPPAASLSADFPQLLVLSSISSFRSALSGAYLLLYPPLRLALSLSKYPCLTPATRQLHALTARSSPTSRVRSFFSWRWRYCCADTEFISIHYIFPRWSLQEKIGFRLFLIYNRRCV